MITFMRRYRRTLQIGLLVIVAAFAASLFIFGTSARDGGAARDSVATVNGEKISVERYQRRYQEYLSMYAQMMRDRFSPEMAERRSSVYFRRIWMTCPAPLSDAGCSDHDST